MITNSPGRTIEVDSDQRWRSRPLASRLLQSVSFLIPVLAALLAGLAIVRMLPSPTTAAGVVGWWVALVLGIVLAMKVFDRIGRRLLPLAWLLRMTLRIP